MSIERVPFLIAGHVEETERMVALSSAWFWNSHDAKNGDRQKKIHSPFSHQRLMRVCIEYDDPLVAELIHSSLSKYFNVENTSASEASLQWSSYESISFETILSNPNTLCNTYIFRKALIRKHFLANTITNWLAKHPESILSKSVPKTYLLECDYADYLDEALNECFELREELGRKLFILKPSMTDRGQGIRLFSTYEELQAIFEEFEQDEDESEEGNKNESEDKDNNGVMASQLRHFVVQEYISPLLVDGRKFHIRAYVVAFGTIKVYVWSEMLALFASKPYSSAREMDRHLTNTCLQEGSDNVFEFWSLPLTELDGIFKQICEITGEVFIAAAAGQQMHFQVFTRNIKLMRHYQTCLKYLAWISLLMRNFKCTFSKLIQY